MSTDCCLENWTIIFLWSLGWSVGSTQYNRTHDVLYAFYDCLCDQVRQEKFCSSVAPGKYFLNIIDIFWKYIWIAYNSFENEK